MDNLPIMYKKVALSWKAVPEIIFDLTRATKVPAQTELLLMRNGLACIQIITGWNLITPGVVIRLRKIVVVYC